MTRIGAAALGGAVWLASLAAGAATAEETATTVCAACHGADGSSPVAVFPKLGGQDEAYLAKQLRDFMAGRRKSDIMAPIVAQLKPQDVVPLAAYYSRLPAKPGATEKKELASVGKLLYFDGNEDTGVPACVGCHGADGIGKDPYPRIAGQHVPYVVQQLKNFATGERANDASRYMRTTAKRMTDEEMNAVAEFLAGLGAR